MSKKTTAEPALRVGQPVSVLQKTPAGEWLALTGIIVSHDATHAAVWKKFTHTMEFFPIEQVFADADKAARKSAELNAPAKAAELKPTVYG